MTAIAAKPATLFAQSLPRLQETNLAGHEVALPDAAKGKIAILVMGFTRGSKVPTSEWGKKIASDYASRGVELYQLPVLEEVPRVIRGMVISGIKNGVPENEREHFVPVLHHESELKKLVGYKEADDAYLVILGRDGNIAYQTHGMFSDAAYAQFRTHLDPLLN